MSQKTEEGMGQKNLETKIMAKNFLDLMKGINSAYRRNSLIFRQDKYIGNLTREYIMKLMKIKEYYNSIPLCPSSFQPKIVYIEKTFVSTTTNLLSETMENIRQQNSSNAKWEGKSQPGGR